MTNEANSHRHISNLFDAKLLAIENLAKAEIDITPVVTVLNSVNNEQVGPILQFCIDNSDKIGSISYQPVSFTGRDEDISDELRHSQRYTIYHLAHELESWSGGKIEAHRDWFPLGAGTIFTALADHLRVFGSHRRERTDERVGVDDRVFRPRLIYEGHRGHLRHGTRFEVDSGPGGHVTPA